MFSIHWMLAVHKRRAHTALVFRAVQCRAELPSFSYCLYTCFDVLLNKTLGWEIFSCFLSALNIHWIPTIKPVNLSLNNMVEISPRIQKLVVRSFPYQPFNVQNRKGVELLLADALRRVTPLPMEEDGIQLPIITVNLVTANIPYSSNELDIIHEEPRKDHTIKILMHYISTGWPCEHRRLPQELYPYWNFREDVSVEDGLLEHSNYCSRDFWHQS